VQHGLSQGTGWRTQVHHNQLKLISFLIFPRDLAHLSEQQIRRFAHIPHIQLFG
jgi:hypothetical protein